MGHGRRDRAEADPFRHLQGPRELDDVRGERPPPVVGLRPHEDEHVTIADTDPAHDQLVPGQLGELAVDDLEWRSPGSVVEDQVGIEARHDRRVSDEVLQRSRGRGPGVDPSVEGRHQGRGDEVPGIGQGVEAHHRRIGDDFGGGG